MPSLADTQAAVRHAVVTGDSALVAPWIVGGRNAEKRLEIHRRHHEASLATAVLGRFPATAWLAGAPFMTEAARHFVREHPPTSPCLAEYGDAFPRFLSRCPGAESLPYLAAFAELDWALGYVSVAVDGSPMPATVLTGVGAGGLLEARLILQPGLWHLRSDWPIDDLIGLYLTDSAPDRFSFEPRAVQLEIRGARGEFQIRRLDPGVFIFRQQVRNGLPIGAAAERALAADSGFDPAQALASVFADGLVVEVTP